MPNVELKERATFSIDAAVKETLEQHIPKSKRSAFVEQAIAEALRLEAVKGLKQTLDSISGASKGGEDSVEILRRLRRNRENHLAERHGHDR